MSGRKRNSSPKKTNLSKRPRVQRSPQPGPSTRRNETGSPPPPVVRTGKRKYRPSHPVDQEAAPELAIQQAGPKRLRIAPRSPTPEPEVQPEPETPPPVDEPPDEIEWPDPELSEEEDGYVTPPRRRTGPDPDAPRNPLRDELPLEDLEMRDEDINHFIEQTENEETMVNNRYRIVKYKASMNIINVRESRNPSGLLRKIFEEFSERAIDVASRFLTPFRLGVTVNNENLDWPIYLPPRTIRSGMNTAVNILKEFKKANQSARNGSLLDATSTIEITISGMDEGRGQKKRENM